MEKSVWKETQLSSILLGYISASSSIKYAGKNYEQPHKIMLLNVSLSS